jgi:UDP-N-acetylmuramoyl-L-alanyl-D-glutamate--2,6-diaminopimelate ligase
MMLTTLARGIWRVSNWTLGDLIADAELADLDGNRSARTQPVTGLAVDSRKVTAGSCFIAVRGVAADGHDFVADAARNGATSIVVERDVKVPDHVMRVRVADTHAAVARLAAAFYRVGQVRDGRRLRLIGVTGTNGKSTTVDLLRSILRTAGHPTAMLGTIEYDLVGTTVPASLTTPAPIELCDYLARAAEAGATYAVMEVSSHALAQCRCDGLNFDVAVFTNLSGDHLDYHQSDREYLLAKKRLFDGLRKGTIAVVNDEDKATPAIIADCRGGIATFGADDSNPHVRGIIRSSDARGSQFDIVSAFGMVENVRTSLVGRHNVMNALAAAGAAGALGVRADSIRRGIEAVSRVHGRLERVSPDDCPFSVMVDYAHTDHALENALRAIRPLTANRVLCVFGCGGDRDRTKRPRMAGTVAQWANAAYVTSDNPRSEDPQAIIEEMLPGFDRHHDCRVHVDPDRAAAIRTAIAAAQPGDTVLIAGKGHETYQIVGSRRVHFDDAEIARASLGLAEVPK